MIFPVHNFYLFSWSCLVASFIFFRFLLLRSITCLHCEFPPSWAVWHATYSCESAFSNFLGFLISYSWVIVYTLFVYYEISLQTLWRSQARFNQKSFCLLKTALFKTCIDKICVCSTILFHFYFETYLLYSITDFFLHICLVVQTIQHYTQMWILILNVFCLSLHQSFRLFVSMWCWYFIFYC